MALAGALKVVPDAPGNVLVVIFPDNIFKYASSVMRHFPELFPAAQAPGVSDLDARLYGEMVTSAKTSRDAVPVEVAKRLVGDAGRWSSTCGRRRSSKRGTFRGGQHPARRAGRLEIEPAERQRRADPDRLRSRQHLGETR